MKNLFLKKYFLFLILFFNIITFYSFRQTDQEKKIQISIIQVQTESKAKEILKQLNQGVSFYYLALKNSVHPSAEKGGDIGFFSYEDLSTEFKEAIKNLKVGECSDIFQIGQSYFILLKANEISEIEYEKITTDLKKADNLSELASQLYQQGRYQEAIPLAHEALQIREKQLGPDHPNFAISLNNLAELYRSLGSYSEAKPLYQQALKIIEKALGPAHPDVAISLNNLALLYKSLGSYSDAEPLYQRALKINEKVLGPDHPYVAQSLNNLAVLYYSMGSYSDVEPLYQQALKIREKQLGPDHPDVAQSLNNLAVLYRSLGSYSDAEPLYQRALKISEKALGPDHPNVATSLNNLAGLYYSMGSYSEAEPLYQRALKINEKALGFDHPDVAASLNGLALLYYSMGSYSEAEPLYQRALKINEKALGSDHPAVATSLSNLAGLYRSLGSYSEVEPLYQRALKINEKALGPDHPGVATDLNNLAGLYYSMGSYSKAESLYQRALKIDEKALGPDHPSVAIDLNNLALLYKSMGSYREVEPFYQRSLKIREEKFGPDHPSVATSLNNLAELYRSLGSYSEAEPLYQRALKIFEKALGPDHPDVATNLNNLALLYKSLGSYSDAEPLYQRALKINEKALGPDHLNVATNLSNIILLWGLKGNCDEIIHNTKRLTLLHFNHYHTVLPYLSEKRQLDYVQEDSPLSPLWPSLHIQYGKKYSEFSSLSSEVLLNQKGIVYEILTTRKRQLKKDDKKVMSLLDSLNTFRTRLANAYFGEPSNVDQVMRFIPSLLAQQERLESKLAREGYDVQTQKTPISPLQVSRSLPEDYALVDFWYFPRYIFKGENRGWSNYHYLAVVYQAKGEPEIIHLGEADSIDKSIIEVRQAIFTDTLNKTQTKQKNLEAEQLVKSKGKKLYQQLFKPILSAIGHNPKVIICADGPLHYLPFGVMVDEQNRYLVERYQFHYVSTGRDILNWGKRGQPSNQNALIVAKSKFQEEPDLKYSTTEAKAINSLLKTNNFSTMLNLEDQARESLLKSVKSPQILHISTHGFFKSAPEELHPAREIGPASFQTAVRRGLLENPLLCSGLILTGTNPTESIQTGDDGTTTALEIAGLDLAETDLVTLSACVTGIGDLKSGEGLYGLHRSFLLAGAKTVLASLWNVPDLETKDLMVEFYRRYLSEGNTVGKTEALRQAQLTVIKNLREKYGAALPAYWGAFVCIGEM